MPIYSGATKKTLFKGNYRPAEFYKGTQKITGYSTSTKTGVEITADNTYNDNLYPVIEGKGWQANPNPTPDNPSPIIVSGGSSVVVEGQNLLSTPYDNSTLSGDVSLVYKSDGSIRISGTPTVALYINFNLKKTIDFQGKYTCSVNDNNIWVYAMEYNSDGVRTQNLSGKGSVVITTHSGKFTYDFKVLLAKDIYYDAIIYPQLTLGTMPHPYTPYKPPIIMPLPEGFGGLEDVSDRIYGNGTKVWWEKNTDEIVFNGAPEEPWYKPNVSNFYIAQKPTGVPNQLPICNIYEAIKYWVGDSGKDGITAINGQIRVYKWSVNTVDDFKQFIQSNPLTVRYQLATPQTVDITDTPTGQAYKNLQTYYPYTHMYSTAQNEVKPNLTAEIKEN